MNVLLGCGHGLWLKKCANNSFVKISITELCTKIFFTSYFFFLFGPLKVVFIQPIGYFFFNEKIANDNYWEPLFKQPSCG